MSDRTVTYVVITLDAVLVGGVQELHEPGPSQPAQCVQVSQAGRMLLGAAGVCCDFEPRRGNQHPPTDILQGKLHEAGDPQVGHCII